jgi:hypothetical protein
MSECPRSTEVAAISRVKVELERSVTKWLRRWPPGSRCSVCGVTNPICLGRPGPVVLCYACKLRRTFEEHSLIGDHCPPRVLTESNQHKVQDEVQRIMARAKLVGVRTQVAIGLAAWIAVRLAALGTVEPGQ